VTDGDTQAKDLLQLELDRRTDLSELVGQVLGVGDGGGELSGLGETGSEQTRNLLNQSFRGQESVVLLSELLDEFLVFVKPGTRSTSKGKIRYFMHELLQVVDRHVLEVNLLSTIDVGGISKNANRHPWPGDIWESVQMNKFSERSML